MPFGTKVHIKRRRRSRRSHPQMEFGHPDDFPVSAGPEVDPDEDLDGWLYTAGVDLASEDGK